MANLAVSAMLSRCAVILQDPTNIRWPQTELLDWLNDGQREIVLYKPNTSVKNTTVTLAAGTKQILPTDGIALIDVVRNMGTSPGTTPGNAIRMVSREILDSQITNWHATTPSATVKHFMFSALDPKSYYVYPPQPNSSFGYVEIIYSASPTDCVNTSPGTDKIQIDDVYATALVNYILYRAYSKDAEYAANAQAALAYYQQFQGILQGKVTGEAVLNPNQALAPFNPNVPGTNK